MTHILRIDTSARHEGSVTRDLLDQLEAKLGAADTRRDLGTDPLPVLSPDWLAANFTPADERTEAQKAALALSDTLVAELQAADTILIALPIYNFSVPGSLKVWIDLVARAGITFRYTEAGPEGLLSGKRVIIAVASGGVPLGSPADYATPYLRHVLGFLGITDVEVVSADAAVVRGEAAQDDARAQIEALAA